ncbi:thioredoxin family protein [Halorussus salinisoli]|uniref:thioredoxin family protein n=1 Tax=Halorussus salinisoli TaxID=2558242 RepID=UPI0010C18C61|nr:thioredoxin family protein [Halorussus salinisoli]
MEPTHEIMALLSERGVIEEAGENQIRPTATFVDSVQDRSKTSSSGFKSAINDVDKLAALQDTYDNTDAGSVYAALTEFVPEISDDERLRVTLLLDGLVGETPETAGVPDPFLPIPGEALPSLLATYERAIVYVWRNDCAPCELVREDLEMHCATQPEGVILLAVYGPASAELLQEEYDVAGGPTVLFVKNGRVDARLLGAHSRETLGSLVEDLVDVPE